MNFITELNSRTILWTHKNGHVKFNSKSKKIAANQIESDNWYSWAVKNNRSWLIGTPGQNISAGQTYNSFASSL